MTFLLRWEDEKGPAGVEKGEAWNRQPGEQVQHPEEPQQQKKDWIRVRGAAAGPGQQGPVHTGSVAQVRRVGFCFCFISEINGAWGGLVLYGEGVHFDSKGDGRRWRLLRAACRTGSDRRSVWLHAGDRLEQGQRFRWKSDHGGGSGDGEKRWECQYTLEIEAEESHRRDLQT